VQSGRTLLTRLSDHGLSWTDIARIVGVSVPAVQKWRRGAGITGENRLRLARLAALLEILERYLIAEPCSWLEMPVITGVSVSGMDLLEADRYDLVLELARGEVAPGDRSSILDEFASDWRESRVDDAFEIVTANDGRLSIQARSQ
jgi:transcriptional regulator with XRE-family HTH domain